MPCLDMKALEREADLFLTAAMRYWNYANEHGMGGAVIWAEDKKGFGALWTRGEYRPTILHNIPNVGPTRSFGHAADEVY